MYINEYIIQGYRTYLLKDFPISHLIGGLPNISRRNRLEIMVIEGIVYVKDTDRYDNKNPYTKKK